MAASLFHPPVLLSSCLPVAKRAMVPRANRIRASRASCLRCLALTALRGHPEVADIKTRPTGYRPASRFHREAATTLRRLAPHSRPRHCPGRRIHSPRCRGTFASACTCRPPVPRADQTGAARHAPRGPSLPGPLAQRTSLDSRRHPGRRQGGSTPSGRREMRNEEGGRPDRGRLPPGTECGAESPRHVIGRDGRRARRARS